MNRTSLIVFAILLLALMLRLPLLNGSFWLDEAAQALESVRPLSEQLQIEADFQPPAFHVLVHFISQISHADWWLRLASLIPGLITVYVVYLIGCQISRFKVGLTAALLLASSQFHVFYSQELRPYSFAAMWAVLSIYYLLDLMKTHRFSWGYVVAATLGMYSVYTFPFLIIAQCAYVAIFQARYFKLIVGHWLMVILLCLPWLPSFLGQFRTGMATTVELPLWKTAVAPPVFKAILLVPPKFIFGRLDLPNTVGQLIPLAAILALVAVLAVKARRHRYFPFLVMWLAVPVILGFLISFKVPLLDPKRFLFCLPALYLLVAIGTAHLKLERYISSALVVLNVIALSLYWTNPAFQREPWKQALKAVESQLTPATTVVFPWSNPYPTWDWYHVPAVKTVSFSPLPISKTSVNRELSTLSQTDTLIYFDYLEDLTDPHRLIRAGMVARGWSQVDQLQYPGIGLIRLYSRTPVYALQ